MKHRGPGASRQPARDAARAQARATRRAAGGSLGGPVAGPRPLPAALLGAVGAWLLVEDEDTGQLVALHEPSGTRTVLATPPPDPRLDPAEGSG